MGWSVQEETFSDQKSSVLSVQSSPSPHSQCLGSYGLPGLGPKLKGCHLPPFSHTWPIPFFPRHYQKTDTQTYLFTTCWYFNHQHLSVLASTEGTSLLFDPCTNDYSVRAFPVVTADCSRSQALGGHRGVLGESLGELEESFRISSSAIGWFSFFFSFWGWWQKTSIFYFFPFLFLPSFCWRVDFDLPHELLYLVRKQSHPERHYWGRIGRRTLREWVCIEEGFCARQGHGGGWRRGTWVE